MASGTFARIADEVAADAGVTLAARQRPLARAAARASASARSPRPRPATSSPSLGQWFALERAAAAHAAIEARATIGKTLLVA